MLQPDRRLVEEIHRHVGGAEDRRRMLVGHLQQGVLQDQPAGDDDAGDVPIAQPAETIKAHGFRQFPEVSHFRVAHDLDTFRREV
jgi:hypothetical protein